MAGSRRALARELVNDMLGLGPLEPLLEDETITDIMVNGPDKVFVERRGKLVLSGVRFRDAAHVANVCQRIAAAVGRRIDESTPMVDARLKDGSPRQHRVSAAGARRPLHIDPQVRPPRIDFDRLIEFGAMTAAGVPTAEDRIARTPQRDHFRRHRLGQDNPAECAVAG